MQHLERIKFVIALIFVGFVIIGTIFYYLLSFGILSVTGFNKFYYSWITNGNGPSNVPIFFGLLAIAASYLLSNVYKKDN